MTDDKVSTFPTPRLVADNDNPDTSACDEFLEAAKGVFTKAIVIGYDTDDDFRVMAESLTQQECLWLMERLKFVIFLEQQ